MKLGIVGLPNVGKSTLFNSMTKSHAPAANFPFCTIEPNIGMVTVPDERLDKLAELYHARKVTPAVIEFVDVAGLVKGAHSGEGLGNQFLSAIRECDAIVHVVRCFEDSDIVHVYGDIDPIRDIEVIDLELSLADLETIKKQTAKVKKLAAAGDKKAKADLETLKILEDMLSSGHMASEYVTGDYKEKRSMTEATIAGRDGADSGSPNKAEKNPQDKPKPGPIDEDEKRFIDSLNLLTDKPVIFAANVSEDDLKSEGRDNPYVAKVKDYAAMKKSAVIVVSARIEEELISLDEDERREYLESMGIKDTGLDKLIKESYDLMGLMSFLTAGEKEVRAWTIKQGTKAPQAAGKIHSDFERGFIRAEVINYHDLLDMGSLSAAREKGLVRSEGKDYVMQEGDTVLFRFNV